MSPAGKLSATIVWLFLLANALVFLGSTAPLLSDEQFAEIWDIFSGFRLFEVADVQVG